MYIPMSMDGTLNKIPVLKGPENFDIWYQHVQNALQEHNMSDLVRPWLPRPTHRDPRYDSWRTYSKMIKSWLFTSLSDDIVKKISSPGEYSYADELMAAIKDAVVGTGRPLSHSAWVDAVYIKRQDYNSIEEFINVLCVKVEHSNKMHMPITPNQAMSILLQSAGDELPPAIKTSCEYSPKDMTYADFLKICGAVKDSVIESLKRQQDDCSCNTKSNNRTDAVAEQHSQYF
ncbi:hypothetical protein MW887_003285 [Aspergillus wentii]|nr:hypothetical protein MW887_003285 [Aspergillus wentii]